MFGKKTPKPQSRIDSLIGLGTRVEGNLYFSGGLRVDGEVVGDVCVHSGQHGTLVLSEQARVTGRVEVSHLVSNGSILGPVRVTEYVELQPKSKVVGDIHYQQMEMHLGAVIEGKMIHAENTPLALPFVALESSPEALPDASEDTGRQDTSS